MGRRVGGDGFYRYPAADKMQGVRIADNEDVRSYPSYCSRHTLLRVADERGSRERMMMEEEREKSGQAVRESKAASTLDLNSCAPWPSNPRSTIEIDASLPTQFDRIRALLDHPAACGVSSSLTGPMTGSNPVHHLIEAGEAHDAAAAAAQPAPPQATTSSSSSSSVNGVSGRDHADTGPAGRQVRLDMGRSMLGTSHRI